jgi:hypothetical protein
MSEYINLIKITEQSNLYPSEKVELSYNDFVGTETLEHEYKEFTFNHAGLGIDHKLAESYCQSSRFDFNQQVIHNLKKYFRNYIPKYTSGFFNSNLKGNLFIGIDDYGYVKGIPYNGKLPFEYLKEKAYEIITRHVRKNHPNPAFENQSIDFEKYIDVNLIQVATDMISQTIQPTVHPKYSAYLKAKATYLEKVNDFTSKMLQWRTRYGFFCQKLVDLVNNPESRLMLIDWIRRTDSNSSVIALLESGHQLEYRDHNDIMILKDDVTNPYYWVCSWKDKMLNIIKEQKPILDVEFTQSNVPINLIVGSGEMIPYWVNNNQDMNVYVIHIHFKQIIVEPNIFGLVSEDDFIDNSRQYSYHDAFSKQWLSCFRTVLPDGNPVCNPF